MVIDDRDLVCGNRWLDLEYGNEWQPARELNRGNQDIRDDLYRHWRIGQWFGDRYCRRDAGSDRQRKPDEHCRWRQLDVDVVLEQCKFVRGERWLDQQHGHQRQPGGERDRRNHKLHDELLWYRWQCQWHGDGHGSAAANRHTDRESGQHCERWLLDADLELEQRDVLHRDRGLDQQHRDQRQSDDQRHHGDWHLHDDLQRHWRLRQRFGDSHGRTAANGQLECESLKHCGGRILDTDMELDERDLLRRQRRLDQQHRDERQPARELDCRDHRLHDGLHR